MRKVYVVDLTPEEREELLGLLKGGEARVRKTNRARILLLADEGRTATRRSPKHCSPA